MFLDNTNEDIKSSAPSRLSSAKSATYERINKKLIIILPIDH
jgi:hypothetical protein